MQGNINVQTKLQQNTSRKSDIRRCIHSVHNCLQRDIDRLCFDIVMSVMKIYSHFHIFTVNVEKSFVSLLTLRVLFYFICYK